MQNLLQTASAKRRPPCLPLGRPVTSRICILSFRNILLLLEFIFYSLGFVFSWLHSCPTKQEEMTGTQCNPPSSSTHFVFCVHFVFCNQYIVFCNQYFVFCVHHFIFSFHGSGKKREQAHNASDSLHGLSCFSVSKYYFLFCIRICI